MKLNVFAVLADENVKPSLVVYLREKGFDVMSVQEEKLFGTTDELLLELANKERRIIITQDDDFAQIVFTQKTSFIGIIHLKPGHFAGDIHIQTLNAILTLNPDVEIPFIISAVNNGLKTKIKVRHFPLF
jgi:predicted nuclease of predicted toxin-antitoxin system